MTWEYLPHDTRAVVAAGGKDCQNLSLLMDRFTPWACTNGVCQLDFHGGARGGDKGKWLTRLTQPMPFNPQVYAQHQARWQACLAAYAVKPFRLQTATPLVVGLGQHTVLETGLTLHRLYGYPYIPGSALKGACRAYALFELATYWGAPALTPAEYLERLAQNPDRRPQTPITRLEALLELAQPADAGAASLWADLLADPALPPESPLRTSSLADWAQDPQVINFRTVFGCMGHTGAVIFWDAVPLSAPRLTVEVMTPHYGKYYGGRGAPGDDDQPNPIPFLVVAPGVMFGFAVAARPADVEPQRVLARKWLQAMLIEYGLGAKTNAGYGLFQKATV